MNRNKEPKELTVFPLNSMPRKEHAIPRTKGILLKRMIPSSKLKRVKL
jgi:hypothetical protein